MIIQRGTGIEERLTGKGNSKMGTKPNLNPCPISRFISILPLPVLVPCTRYPFPVPRFSNHHCPNDNFSLLTNKKVMQNFIKTATSAKENCSRISRRRPPKCEELVFAHGGGRLRSFPRRSGNTWRECTACNFQVKLYVNPCCLNVFLKP